jgi:hypothetical protein
MLPIRDVKRDKSELSRAALSPMERGNRSFCEREREFSRSLHRGKRFQYLEHFVANGFTVSRVRSSISIIY